MAMMAGAPSKPLWLGDLMRAKGATHKWILLRVRGENVRDAFGRPIGLMRHAVQHKHFLELETTFP